MVIIYGIVFQIYAEIFWKLIKFMKFKLIFKEVILVETFNKEYYIILNGRN